MWRLALAFVATLALLVRLGVFRHIAGAIMEFRLWLRALDDQIFRR